MDALYNAFYSISDKVEFLKDKFNDSYCGYVDVYETLSHASEMSKGEDFHSTVLAALLKNRKNNYGVLKSFLTEVVAKVECRFVRLSVTNPRIEACKGYVDLQIKDTDYTVIIENKVCDAKDQPSQIARYIEVAVHGAHYNENMVNIIYLTYDATKNLTEQSWIRKEFGKKTGTNYRDDFVGRYAHINYRCHILPWLRSIKDRFFDNFICDFLNEYISFLELGDLRNVSKLCESLRNKCNDRKIEKAKRDVVKYVNCGFPEANAIQRVSEALDSVMANLIPELMHKHFEEWKCKLANKYGETSLYSIIDCDYPKVGLKFNWIDKEGRSGDFYCVIEYDKSSGELYYGLYHGAVIEENDLFIDKSKELINLFYSIDRYTDRYQSDANNVGSGRWFYWLKNIPMHTYSEREFEFVFDFFLLDILDKIIDAVKEYQK